MPHCTPARMNGLLSIRDPRGVGINFRAIVDRWRSECVYKCARTIDNQQPAVRTLLDYYAAFNTLDVKVTLPYFHEPALLLGSQGVFAASTHDILTPVLTWVIDSLRARGFA